jgi:enamine deaminase RidA (YjgF/YER057c/UK114 family)
MSGGIEERLKRIGIDLPTPPAPVASYVPFVRTGNLIFISGQVTLGPDGLEYVGVVGDTIDMEDAKKAARLCAINVIAQLKAALKGRLDLVRQCVKVTGFVNAIPSFGNHPEVINGASDLFVEVFGEAGRHARAAVGAGSLPRGVAVEVEAIFEVE